MQNIALLTVLQKAIHPQFRCKGYNIHKASKRFNYA